jgi:hypothetical protein
VQLLELVTKLKLYSYGIEMSFRVFRLLISALLVRHSLSDLSRLA